MWDEDEEEYRQLGHFVKLVDQDTLGTMKHCCVLFHHGTRLVFPHKGDDLEVPKKCLMN